MNDHNIRLDERTRIMRYLNERADTIEDACKRHKKYSIERVSMMGASNSFRAIAAEIGDLP